MLKNVKNAKTTTKFAYASTALAVLILFISGGETIAFKPDSTDHGHRMITKSVLTSGYSYRGKTVANFSTILSTGRPVSFSEPAAEDVAKGNATNDYLYDDSVTVNGVDFPGVKEFMEDTAHCDNETIYSCSVRIAGKLNGSVLDQLKSYALLAEAEKTTLFGRTLIGRARLHLGKSLHTLQDFYAHSDHANRRPDNEIFQSIYVLNIGNDRPFKSGISSNPYVGRKYNECMPMLGGNYSLDANKNSSLAPTTGYFAPGSEWVAGALIVGSFYPAANDNEGEARCDHGMYSYNSNTLNGINKDDANPFYGIDIPTSEQKKMREAHTTASYQAAQHTLRLLNDLILAIKSYPGVTDAQRDTMIAGLLGVDLDKPVYGFVVDTTGSMSSIISGVKTQIQKLIDDSVASGKSTDQRFLLLDYGDPYIGSAFSGTAAEVKAKVATLTAGGGGDCPELAQGAVSRAIEAAPENSTLFVFTDASAKDSALGESVAKAATAKKIAVTYVASGSCSPIDPSYYAVAAATGGQVLVTDHTSAAVAAAFTSISIEGTGSILSPVAIQRGTLAAAKTVDMVVESGASTLSVVATLDSGTVEFKAPDGSIVVGGGSVRVSDFLGGRGIKVNNPAAGTWTVIYMPSGSSSAYSLRADVGSTTNFAELTFLDDALSGRPGHESYVPFAGMPPIGSVRFRAHLVGAIADPVFEAVLEDGSVGERFASSRETEEYYGGTATISGTPFRIRVTGLDASGKMVVRVLPTLYAPRNILVRIVDAPRFLLGGITKVYAQITNRGSAGKIDMAGSSTIGSVTAVNPVSVTLATGASILVEISASMPASIDSAAKRQLDISAIKDGATESTTLPFDVLADSDGDGVPDEEEMGPTGTDPLYDGNGDGKPDYLQAEVISLHSRIRNAYISMSIDGPGQFALATAAKTLVNNSGLSFPLDLFDFKIVGLANGAATKVKIQFPNHLVPGGYAKYGPLPTNTTPSWYSFTDDGVTGARLSGNYVTLSFVDGKRGDDDLTANGEIVDLGGPVEVKLAGVKDSFDAAAPEHDSGGGCTTGRGSKSDASLIMLLIAALGFRAVKRRKGCANCNHHIRR